MNISVFFADKLIDSSPLPVVQANKDTLSSVLTIVFTTLGALAFLMIVISGFRYVISQGQPEKVAEIKRQMVYAFVGLVIAASAAAIVNFVLGAA